MKPPKHCFMYRTATKQQKELEICVHDTTLPLSFFRGKGDGTEWNEIQPVFPRLFHTHTDRMRESQYMFPICVTLRSGLLAGLRRCVSPRAPAWHVRHERVLHVYPFYLFILYPDLLSPSPFSTYCISPLMFLSAIHFSVYSCLSSHLSSVASSLSAPSLSPAFCLSIFSSPGLTVWKVDESDCKWQSGIWVNLMWLIWCLLTALWKSFTVEEHWDTATLWPSCPLSLCCSNVCVGGACVYLCKCECMDNFSLWSKVSSINGLPFSLPTHIIPSLTAIPSRVHIPRRGTTNELHWMT